MSHGTTGYFEIHVTLEKPTPANGNTLVWKKSQINGDPDLGDGVRHYRTTHTASFREAVLAIDEAKRLWPDALRYKVEHILLDERRG